MGGPGAPFTMPGEGPPRKGYCRQYGSEHHLWSAFWIRYVCEGMMRAMLESHRRLPKEEFPLESDEHLETVVGVRAATSLSSMHYYRRSMSPTPCQ